MNRKQEDTLAWEKWRRSQSPMDLDELNRRMNGIIQKEVNRWAGVLAREVLEMEALRLAKQAYTSYNPTRGTALSTHLTNYLQKLSRMVYSHQNVARMPEYQVLKLRTFKTAWADLEDLYRREPTVAELAQQLRWSQAAVKEYIRLLRSEQTESVVPTSVFGAGEEDPMIHLVYHDLAPQQQQIFEHTTGYGGKDVLSTQDMAKKLNMSPSKLQYEKRKLVARIKHLMD